MRSSRYLVELYGFVNHMSVKWDLLPGVCALKASMGELGQATSRQCNWRLQVRELYRGFDSRVVKSQLAVQKKVGESRESLVHRTIMNYQSPAVKRPLKTYKETEFLSLFE